MINTHAIPSLDNKKLGHVPRRKGRRVKNVIHTNERVDIRGPKRVVRKYENIIIFVRRVREISNSNFRLVAEGVLQLPI